MNIDHPRLVILTAGLALCAEGGCTPIDVGMGDSLKHNYALQIVDPDPLYDDDATSDGEPAAGAVERYRTDKVKKPVSIKTTTGGSGAGSGGGSSGGR